MDNKITNTCPICKTEHNGKYPCCCLECSRIYYHNQILEQEQKEKIIDRVKKLGTIKPHPDNKLKQKNIVLNNGHYLVNIKRGYKKFYGNYLTMAKAIEARDTFLLEYEQEMILKTMKGMGE